MSSGAGFHRIPECAEEWVSLCNCFSCLFLDSFPSLCLFCLVQMCWFLFPLILFYFHPLDVYLFFDESQKNQSGSGWEGMWGGPGKSREKENCNQDYYMDIFSTKK